MMRQLSYYIASVVDELNTGVEYLWNDIDRGSPKYSKKILFQCHVSTTGPTWTRLGLSPWLYCLGPVIKCLNSGTAILLNEKCDV